MSRLTLRQLKYLIAVGETGSIARAADRLNVSSPSISAAITRLEEQLAISLFVRQHAQGLSLTKGGERVLHQARQVLNGAREIANIAADISGTARGPLGVGCLLTFAQLELPRLRRGFESDFPDVRIVQNALNQAEILNALQRSEIDVALTYDMDIPTDLNFIGLVRLSPFALLHAEHELAKRDSVSIDDLAELPIVLLDLPISADYFLSLFEAHAHPPHIVERTRDMAVMRSMVGNGFGYSIANVRPQSNVAQDGSPVTCVPISGPIRPLRMGLLTTHGADTSRTVRAFINYAKEQVRSGAFDAIGGTALVCPFHCKFWNGWLLSRRSATVLTSLLSPISRISCAAVGFVPNKSSIQRNPKPGFTPKSDPQLTAGCYCPRIPTWCHHKAKAGASPRSN